VNRFFKYSIFLNLALFASLAAAQTYPGHPLRLIVPFPPGGATDVLGRIVAAKLGDGFNQPVVVENRAGAAGAIGSEAAARSPGDGYTLLLGSTTTISINPALNPKLPYSPQRDFVPIGLIGYVPHIVVIANGIPAKNITEFVAYAKANPGKLAFGSSGTGSPHHLAGEIFKKMTGIDMVHVPFKGSAPAMNAVMSGDIHFASLDFPVVAPQVGGGKLRPIAIAATARDPLVPEVPTSAESGLPGFEITGWYGIFAPAATPRDIVGRLSAEMARLLALPDTRATMAKTGTTVLALTSEQFAAHIKREDAKWSKAIQDSGAKPE
jgi:tripartite-type tricarboxylate transporter receptor subunit TctC